MYSSRCSTRCGVSWLLQIGVSVSYTTANVAAYVSLEIASLAAIDQSSYRRSQHRINEISNG